MVLKRPLGDEESCEHPWKQPRQMECSNDLPYFREIVSRTEDAQISHISGYESEGCLNKCQYVDRLVSENVAVHKESETSAPSNISSFSWVSGGEELKSESAVRLSYFPGIFDHDHLTRPRADEEERYSSVFNSLPRRLVSLGPDHQADVPACGSTQNINDDYAAKMNGTCLIPMPDSKAFDILRNEAGNGRTDCHCEDQGSVRCVRQHITESREKLLKTLGQETFEELGFHEMGEEVARKWSEEEQEVFHEIIFSNPASIGKNFWDHLSVVFPSRTKKEIVSYYFNVFMLRKRAAQNRLDPLNADSDNDEWQPSEDGEEDDSDSVVESPEVSDYPRHIKHIVEDDDNESCDEEEKKLKKPKNCEEDEEEENDLQDDSCTSYEYQLNRDGSQECRVETDQSKHFESNYDGLYDDAKVWDVGFLSSFKRESDLLPTFNMIEEVFGDEAWISKGRDGNGNSNSNNNNLS